MIEQKDEGFVSLAVSRAKSISKSLPIFWINKFGLGMEREGIDRHNFFCFSSLPKPVT
jgi:hypothetical protein